tara:strand:- start:640 stop:1182 length:543 start_codon:yes stop_codon:yes gene_type:complete
MAKAKKEHYVDNEKFFQAMCEWKKEVIEADDLGESRPPVSEYIGECFMKIAEHLSYKPNFINYEYREEMIGDGIENCLMYAHNFDPEKSKNPFSYFTQMIYYAFLRRIQKEKKQMYVKYKVAEQSEFYKHFPTWEDDKTLKQQFNLTETDIENFTPKSKKKKEKKQEDSSGATLDEFFGE